MRLLRDQYRNGCMLSLLGAIDWARFVDVVSSVAKLGNGNGSLRWGVEAGTWRFRWTLGSDFRAF
jgi:hypothetical protein